MSYANAHTTPALTPYDALQILWRTWGGENIISAYDSARLEAEARENETLLETASRISGVWTRDLTPYLPETYMAIRERCARRELQIIRGHATPAPT